MNRMRKAIWHSDLLLLAVLNRCASFFPDKLFIRLKFRLMMGRWPDLKHPRTFNEKLQWLKLYNRRPEYSRLVDKFAVKHFVSEKIGEQYVIPTLGVWNDPEEIDFCSLPDQFVLKTTHSGGGSGVIICEDKKNFDIAEAQKRLSKSLKSNLYKAYREWPYKSVPRRIIAEKLIIDSSGELNDYKFFCFGGKVKFLKVDFDRRTAHHANYYDRDWNLLPFGEISCPPDPQRIFVKPPAFDSMIEAAERLSAEMPFVRIDLYTTEDRIYFGEITFFPAAGMGGFTDERWDDRLGDWIEL